MKYTFEQIDKGEDEVIVRYKKLTPEVDRVLGLLRKEERILYGMTDEERVILRLPQILYIESVDGKTFAYTKEEVVRLDYTLYQLEEILIGIQFFRCSKSMIINIDHVKRLKSLSSNRIEACMCNGEIVMISRTYASDFRKRLKRGSDNE